MKIIKELETAELSDIMDAITECEKAIEILKECEDDASVLERRLAKLKAIRNKYIEGVI